RSEPLREDALAGRWRAYDEAAIQEARKAGKTVFIDFTADWCITCKANETLVLHRTSTEALFDQYGAKLFKGDWTTGDPVITAALHRFGAEGVPLYVVLPADPSGEPIVLPTLLTSGIVEEALQQAASVRQPE
ncbi:MAG: thioredoxin family protein, partial [Bdellovibrionales bacterium]|nr:thioredoxin family protein [Bdellovibrionales bacterium]